ncbi:BamA/TamA family outer membrane protein [Mucilaginibacter sp. AW1-3]
MVRKITLNGIDKQYQLAAVNYVDKEQQPNNWLNLQFYYAFSKHGKNDIGEAPRILDSDLVEFSRVQIEKFLIHKGYLKAKVENQVKIKGKKAELIFNATEGPLFKVQKVRDSIEDPHVKILYNANRSLVSHIKVGDPYDIDSLALEREDIFQLMKRNGYFDFYRQSINYNYDTAFNKSAVAVTRIISNPPDDDKHEIYTINNTLITIYASNGKPVGKADSIKVDSQFTFVDYSHKFKPSALTNYIFQRKGDQYNIEQQNLTTARLSELNVFRNVPNPTYTKTADSTNRLDSRIDIIPLKHMSDRVEAEFIFNLGGNTGFNIDNTFTDRNLFKGAEILQLKLSWSVLFNGSSTAANSIQNQDFKAGLSLVYPRIISPFKLPIPGKYGVPHTTISSNYQLFFQDGLVSRKSIINSITYDWAETPQKLHSLTPINIEFSKGIIDPTAQSQLVDQNRYSYVYLIGRTIFTAGSKYSYQVNANKLYSLDNFIYFRGAVDVGGNTLSLLSNLFNTSKDSLGQRTLFGQTFAQYAKAETDVRFYRRLNLGQEFVFRFNAGIGVPYGNSSQLIFEKNFYAGGSNDIRSWLPRTLGPGQFNRATAYTSDTLRNRLKYLDQFGEIKIVGNAEYRFGLLDNFFGSKLNGALFTDFGNVWRLKPETDSPDGTFGLNNLFQSTAIGVGTGLRFDLSFFVFRLDMAFKFKDPQFSGSEQWVLLKHGDELFRAGSFKHNYQVANGGDPYSFMQLNFGIGLPF